MKKLILTCSLLILISLTVACGRKGPLFLPNQKGDAHGSFQLPF